MSTRRYFLGQLSAALAAGTALPAGAQASYPDKPVRIIVPYAAGGAVDPLVRIVAEKLGKQLGMAFIVDNRPGAGGRIGTDAVVRSAPDGLTLLGAASGVVINPILYPKNAYDLDKDLTPIGVINRIPMVVIASPQLGIKTLPELLKLARDKPHIVNYGISGIGTLDHLVAERLRAQEKLDIVQINYLGVPQALNGLFAGDIPLMVIALSAGMTQIKAGKVVPLAITSATRSKQLPDVPTMAEAGVANFVMYGWSVLFAPSGVPAPIIQKLHDEVAKTLAQPDVQKFVADGGGEVVQLSLPDLKDFVRKDQALFAEIIRKSNIKVE